MDTRTISPIKTDSQMPDEPIAIIGMGCRLPGDAIDLNSFWKLLIEGGDAISEVPPERWDGATYYDADMEAPGKMCTRWGGFVKGVDLFDPTFFGISPREAEAIDPQQRLLLEVTWEALEHAGVVPTTLNGSNTAVFIGTFLHDYEDLLTRFGNEEAIDAYRGIGNALSATAGRISYLLGLQGTSMAIDTASSASLVAIHTACHNLRDRESNLAIVGGVNLTLSPDISISFSKAHMLSPDGRCKSFDAKANGYVRGEGCGVVILKRLQDAIQDGDRILAVIKGSAVNQDGMSNGLAAPNCSAQEAMLRHALHQAGAKPSQIDYIETHGSGTPLGDPIEIKAINAVFGSDPERPATHPLIVGSVKTNIGHLEAAAGIVGVIKVVLSLVHSLLPRHLNFQTPNPSIDFHCVPIKILLEAQPWLPRFGADHPTLRLAGVSSFGFTGTNAHLLIEEAPPLPVQAIKGGESVERSQHLVCVSAKSEQALHALISRYIDYLQTSPQSQTVCSLEELPDIAFTANACRVHFPYRIAVVASDCKNLQANLQAGDYHHGHVINGKLGKVAFLCTGQGSQYNGMGLELYENCPVFRDAIAYCAKSFSGQLDIPLKDLLFDPKYCEMLAQTQYSQPALFAIEYAMAMVWMSWGVSPHFILGYADGEVLARCLSGMLSIEDALDFIVQRAEFLQELIQEPQPDVSLDAEVVLTYANILLEKEVLDVQEEAEESDDYQMRTPTSFFAGIQSLKAEGVTFFIELGPQPILLTLATQYLPDEEMHWLPSLMHDKKEWEQLHYSLAEMYCAGFSIDWKAYDSHYARKRVSLPTYPFQRQHYWAQAAHPHPYGVRTKVHEISTQTSTSLLVEVANTLNDFRLNLQKALPYERLEVIAQSIRRIIRTLMRLPDDFPLEEKQRFFALGMDSLMVTEMLQKIQVAIGSDFILPPTTAFDYPSIDRLAHYLEQNLHPTDEISQHGIAPISTTVSQTPRDTHRYEDIAIIGLGCRFPGGANDPESFWKVLMRTEDVIREVPKERWNSSAYYDVDVEAPGKMCTRYGAFLDKPVDQFDASFFHISPREAEFMDPQQRLLLEVGWEALEHAGIAPDGLQGSATGVFMGISNRDFLRLLDKAGDTEAINSYVSSGTASSVAVGRLSYLLGLQGPNLAVDTACSSSLVALHQACQSLRMGECTLALAGGVNVMLAPEETIQFSKAKMLAPDGHCKTFDAAANGYVRGEGCGIVILKTLELAQREGDTILAVIKASGINQDGASSGLTVPNGAAQEALLRKVLGNSSYRAEEIDYVEAHGTGTPLGDPIEVRAIGAVYGRQLSGDHILTGSPLLIGSVKTNVGHLEAAAGIAGLIKVILALQKHIIPAHLHFKQSNPRIDLASIGVTIPTTPQPWELHSNKARVAAVSSFGFSGTNAHLIIAEAPSVLAPQNECDRPAHLLALSGFDENALQALIAQYADPTCLPLALSFANIAYTANTGRAHFEHRIAVFAKDLPKLQAKLVAHSYQQGVVVDTARPRVAFLFTGQGSQYPGMAKELYDAHPVFRSTLDRCAALLKEHMDAPLLELLFAEDSKERRLDQTGYTQPAIFSLEYALAMLWMSWGVRPDCVMGHSVGEYAAATIAGILTLEEGLKLIAARARLMQALPTGGMMAAIVADSKTIMELLAKHPHSVDVAAINTPQQVVISGEATAVDSLIKIFASHEIEGVPLQVSHAFHSVLIEPMLADFRAVAESVSHQVPRYNLISNVTGCKVERDTISAEYWIQHARQPVRFLDGMQALHKQGCTLFLEIGPHPILLGMGMQCLLETENSENNVWLPSLRRGKPAWDQMLDTLAKLYVRGVKIDWNGFEQPYNRNKVILPTYPFQRKKYWAQALIPKVTSLRRLAQKGHPLLGVRFPSAAEMSIFESVIDLAALPHLADHSVFGCVIFPGAAFIEMVLTAGYSVLGTRNFSIVDFAIEAPLELKYAIPSVVQLLLTNAADGLHKVTVYSVQRGVQEAQSSWKRHVSCSLLLEEEEVVHPSALSPGICAENIVPKICYEQLSAAGLDYGPAFRSMQSICVGDREWNLELKVAEDVAEYACCPALLDGCFQFIACHELGITDSEERTGDVFLPIGIQKLRLYAPLGNALRAHITLAQGGSENKEYVLCDIALRNPNGDLLAQLHGYQAKRTTRKVFLGILNGVKNQKDIFYQTAWIEQPRAILPPNPKGAQGTWVVMATYATLAVPLLASLRQMGASTILVTIGAHYEKLSDDHYQIKAINLEDLQVAFAEIAAKDTLQGVVYACMAQDPLLKTVEQLHDFQEISYGTFLLTLQVLLEMRLAVLPRVHLVTAGCYAVHSWPINPAQAPLSGLVKTLLMEHPEVECKHLDIESSSDNEELAKALIAEMGVLTEEPFCAVRGSMRYVARFVRDREVRALENHLAIPEGSYSLTTTRGALENLHLLATPLPPLQPEQVAIAVRASGLNFRDVLNAMGLYPGDPGALGLECSGIVTSVGSAVSTLQVGDEVLGIAAGCFGNVAVTDARLLIKKPARLTFSAAATIPIVFLTAYLGLIELAALQQGEKVLIHAAAGGVGLAAVQLAQSVGATIIATAGSPRKRAYLASLGIAHIFDSRSLDFAQQIQDFTDKKGVEVVLNSLSADFIPKSLSALGKEGRFIEIGKRDIWSAERLADERPDVKYSIIAIDVLAKTDPDKIQRLLQSLIPLFEAGQLHPLLHTVFPLEHSISAFRYMQQARHMGKIVIAPPLKRKAILNPEGTYFITGGLGGLGLKLAQYLVDNGARYLVLVGRSAPSAEAHCVLDGLRAQGAKIVTSQTDVGNLRQLTHLFDKIKMTFPNLKGVFHAAGLLDDATLLSQNWKKFEAVFAAKGSSAWNLHQLTKHLDLEIFVLFSSIVAVLGSRGQSNYAAANAFLDGLAHYRKQQGLPALSINWGPWAEVGMAVKASRSGKQGSGLDGFIPLDPKDAMQALTSVLGLDTPQIAIAPIDWPQLLAILPRHYAWLGQQKENIAQAATKSNEFLLKLAQAIPSERPELIRHHIRELARKVLGLGSSDALPSHKGFNTLGMDSLTTVEFKNTIQATLGSAYTLPTTALFDYPTITTLADYIKKLIYPIVEGEVAAVANKKEDVLPSIEASDEEIAALLHQEFLDSER